MMRIRALVRADDDRGVALPMVLGVGAVLLALMVAGVSYAIGTLDKARDDQDWSSALAAAYAGIEEYQSRLADDPRYYDYGNPASTFRNGSDLTLPTGTAANPAFGLGTSGSWATVAGSGGEASYRYEVDSSQYSATGTLRLRATGRAGGETRTIVADLRQEGFIDFLYFTDYEIQDPLLSGVSASSCVRYAWAGRSTTGCGEIAFGSNDLVAGPAHSNDIMRVCNAEFSGKVTTAYAPGGTALRYTPRDSNYNSCSGQVFSGGLPTTHPNGVISMPPTNTQLKRETRSDLTALDVPNPGCLYTGPTTITLNSNGTMTVRSPWTKRTQVVGDPATSGTSPAACGTPGTAAGGLGSAGGATVNVPENNVVYVQDVPVTSTDPNYTASGSYPSGLTTTCTTGANGRNGMGYPITNEVTPLGASSTYPAYGCRKGDVFIKGTLDGSVTIAAENYVYVVGNLVYEDRADDILGLIGNNAVFVWNPVNSSGNKLLGDTNRTIDAAILSVSHTFQVQNYNTGGNRGTLNVYGAIAQKFRGVVRGTVGGVANGYAKNYVYDDRFRYTAPPKFLSPVNTTYGVSVAVEVSPTFDAAGAYR